MISDVDAAIANGRRWLWETCIVQPEAGCTGWPQHSGTTELTVWGGTLDALRALRRERANQPLDPRLHDALAWIRSQQLPGGGFDSCEIDYPAAETTAWVLVMMGEFAIEAGDPHVAKALSYLLRCVTSDGVVTTTPDDPQNQRVMPRALALWALSKYQGGLSSNHRDSKVGIIIEKLRRMQDPEVHGWGISLGTVPNVATTAQVVHALCTAGVAPTEEIVQSAMAFLISRQAADGGWPNSYEEWAATTNPRRLYRCLHHTTWWALIALIPSTGHSTEARTACRSAVKRLLDTQLPDGSWRHEEYEANQHTWLTAQIVVALDEWRGAHVENDPGSFARVLGDTLSKAIGVLRKNTYNILLAILLALQVTPFILGLVIHAGRYFGIDRASLANNILSSALWAFSVFFFAALIARLRKK